MGPKIEAVHCALGDGEANKFLAEHPEWELHTVVGISGDADTFGAPGYIFIKRAKVTASFATT